jgi:hypothetical protein
VDTKINVEYNRGEREKTGKEQQRTDKLLQGVQSRSGGTGGKTGKAGKPYCRRLGTVSKGEF